MIVSRKFLAATASRILYVVRPSSTSCNDGFTFNPKFSASEQEKILTIINQSTTEQLSRFNMSQVRIKNLDSFRNKKGPFRTLSDVLEVEGLGVKVLERLCESIITNKTTGFTETKTSLTNNGKSKRLLLNPPLPMDTPAKLKSAVGLYLTSTGISWAKLICDSNNLKEWHFYSFSNLPKKMLPTDTFDLAIDIIKKLPTADIYVLEALQNPSPQQQNQSIAASYNHQMELNSMLVALINTSPKHNPTINKEVPVEDYYTFCENRVHYLRAKVPARLFKTLVGNERVSATSAISTLLEDSSNISLPCSQIVVEKEVKDMYYANTSVHQEILGQSLLLVISFMDLCIYQNPISLKAIAPGSNRRPCLLS